MSVYIASFALAPEIREDDCQSILSHTHLQGKVLSSITAPQNVLGGMCIHTCKGTSRRVLQLHVHIHVHVNVLIHVGE